MNIAFQMMGGEGWTVGPIFQRNLFNALRQTYQDRHRLFVLAPAGLIAAEEYARDLDANGLILYGPPRSWTPYWVINELVVKRLFSRDLVVERLLKKHQIDVVFGPALRHRFPNVATLSWLWDFQHIHLPEMFDPAERLSRDRAFLQSAELASRIIVKSDSIKEDFESFAPSYAHKVEVLRPASYVPQSVYDSDLQSILRLYHLPEKIVYLPSQFWKHKNHETVFRAVKALKDQGVKVTLVCSGDPSDHRHPDHFAHLLQRVSGWGVRDQVIFLGMIPYEHVLLLMRQSVCVLNPSLFEGWGSAVDEAKSVGKRVLLSDIPVHHEHNAPQATYFNPHDYRNLAERLAEIWINEESGPDHELESEAQRALPDRLRTYADSFVSIAQEASAEQ